MEKENEREREKKREQNISVHPFPFSLLFLALLHRRRDLMEAFYIMILIAQCLNSVVTA